MTFEIAKRQAVPNMIAFVGTSGAGKTYSALLAAAGLAGENGKVGFIDTELGRGSMYADDPDIIAAMPDGKYFIKNLTEPFTPKKYAAAIREAIEAKVDVLVIDSATHWWEGFGGCQDIAENNKLGGMPNWAMAKMEHKKLMNLVTQCPMHIIFCVRAREKSKPVKVIDKNGNQKTEIVSEGLQPIHEKNFMYDMTLSMTFTEDKPGKPTIAKCPKPLKHLFDGEQTFITKELGEKLRSWSMGGESIDKALRELERKCKEAAGEGNAALDAFLKTMKKGEKTLLEYLDQQTKDDLRATADEADKVRALKFEADEEKSEPKKVFND